MATIEATDLKGFEDYPVEIKTVIQAGLTLTRRNLGYRYGSADPDEGSMDCSGTIYYLLRQCGLPSVPRSASEQYLWARKESVFYAVISRKPGNVELGDLRPGDLMFWTGTYAIDRDPPVTHTMIYLGKLKKGDRHVMFGASDGRTFDGRKIYGVSVFDFFPASRKESGAQFVGYARIPGIEKLGAPAASSE